MAFSCSFAVCFFAKDFTGDESETSAEDPSGAEVSSFPEKDASASTSARPPASSIAIASTASSLERLSR